MPEAARGNLIDTVQSPDGSGDCCQSPSTQYTLECSSKVFVEGYGIVRQGDAMQTHNYDGPCCNPHSPTLTVGSSKVFIEGKQAARKGDSFDGTHMISSGSSKIFIG
jgi:uncharacterized Zn-binding protein involved in type VI secretion